MKTLFTVTNPLLLRVLWCSFVILALSACSDQKYTVELTLMDPVTKAKSTEIREFEASNDTAAFVRGTQTYWVQKTSIMKTNRMLESKMPIPFYFVVYRDDQSPVRFPADVAERISADVVNYFRDNVVPFIDTITPISKRPQERTAEIY